MTELPEPGVLAGQSFRRLAGLQPTVISSSASLSPGSSMARIPVTVQGIVAGASGELTMPSMVAGRRRPLPITAVSDTTPGS
jgi:hypothetical protein